MKKKRLSVSVAEDRETPKVVSGKVKPRNPIAANPLLGKAARHKTRKSRQGESRANIRQALRRAAKGGTSSDDWQNSSPATVVAVLPVISTSDTDVRNIAGLGFPDLLDVAAPLELHLHCFMTTIHPPLFLRPSVFAANCSATA